MLRKPEIKLFVVIFGLTTAFLLCAFQFGLIERIAYDIESGQQLAMRESLAKLPNMADSAVTNRAVARLAMPAVLSIETELPPVLAAEPGVGGAKHDLDWLLGSATDLPAFADAERTYGSDGQSDSTARSRRGVGSGFIYDASGGLALTNAHVIDGADTVRVRLADGREAMGTVLGVDHDADLAVVRVNLAFLRELPFGDNESVAVGDEVFAVGNPFGLQGTVSKGIISAVDRRNVAVGDDPYESLLQTDAVISPGSSGGPLLNKRGEVIGINTARATNTGRYEGVGFAIPADRAQRIAAALVDGRPGFLGVIVDNVADPKIETDVRAAGWKDSYGVFVQEIVPGLAADRAGLKPRDIILELETERVGTTCDLGRMVALREPGTPVSVRVWRDGGPVTLPVQIGGRTDLQ